MKIPTPRDRGQDGYYGGVGTRPAPRAWTPKRKAAGDAQGGEVPRRLRGLRLRRRRRASMERQPLLLTALIALIIGVMAVIIVAFLAEALA